MDTHENGWKSGDDGVYEVAMSAEDRLQAAADVVRSLQARLTLATSVIESYRETVKSREAVIMYTGDFMRRLAANLAGCVGASHSGKNIVLLETISDLLTMADRKFPQHEPDDIPF